MLLTKAPHFPFFCRRTVLLEEETLGMADVLQKLRENTFETRDRRVATPNVQVGSYVRVGIRGERFWCRVSRERSDGSLLAQVDSYLTKSPWKRGDEIVLQRSHVLEAVDDRDALVCRALWATLGSAPAAAMAWRASKDESFNQSSRNRSKWFVLPN